MPMLKNQRHELFCQGIASGLSATQAYIKAGYSANGAEVSASRLLTKANIRERVMELKPQVIEAVEKETKITKAWVLNCLQKNYFRAMQEEEVIDREGKPTGEFVYQGTVANRALELMGKELGMFVDRKDVTVRTPDRMTDAELAAELAVLGDEQAATSDRVPSPHSIN